MRISPSFLSLLGAGRSFAFKARIMDGGVKGVCRQDKTTGKWAIDMAFSNVGLEDMAFFNQLPVRQITGTAGGKIQGDFDGRQVAVRSDLVLLNVMVALKEPVLSIDAVTFDRIETALTANGDRLRIERLTGKGKQMEGDLAGDILVRRPFAQSSLRLKGNIKPQAGLTAALGKSSSVDVLLSHVGEQGFPIELKGTLAAPGFSLK
ncbi:MAG: type II secretion system protein GspN [Thermodesulfobacteriota bacterium]